MPRRVSRIARSSSTTKMLGIQDLRRGGCLCGKRKLQDKLSARRMVLLYADAAVMVFHDAAHDGESQPSATLLGRDIRQEEFFFYFVVNAVAAIGDCNLQRVFAFRLGRSDMDLLDQRVLRG